ncbi:hypothetical protein BT96DRAFT_237017 [Gymnopus androsaceus JB14]|uniref:Aminoglycoside phosphotransferase domain-containing protein n=1 Tax=Gymnopus androsaceus JB14 TaxID=1447944 RepID=A0A6A4IJV2_9AGAR|nr:hypothetical protein BT96DRAFT_237017 [Gymnopus androsaceus JB14]
MDYVKGRTIGQVWPTYSIWQKITVAFTLRRYLRQLHRLKTDSSPPGPIGNEPSECDSPIFSVRPPRGPFASYAELSDFFDERCKMGLDDNNVPYNDSSRTVRFDDLNSSPLVMTHQDLNPRNIIVSESGRIWIVDWEKVGYYPPWFEYVTMDGQMKFDDNYIMYDNWIPFICGPYFPQLRWLLKMSTGLYYNVFFNGKLFGGILSGNIFFSSAPMGKWTRMYNIQFPGPCNSPEAVRRAELKDI